MRFYAIKKGLNPGIYTNLYEVFKNVDKNKKRGYEICKNENKARKVMGYPTIEDFRNSSVDSMIDYSFNEIKDGSIEKYKNKIKKNGCVAYVDGSFNKNKKVYGAGVVFITNDKIYTRKESYRDKYIKHANTSGEVLSVILAIDMAIEFGFKNITIYHDATLPTPNMNGKIKAKSPIMKMFLEYLNSVRCVIKCNFKKVKAHSGDYYNNQADKLAKLASGVKQIKLPETEIQTEEKFEENLKILSPIC